MKSKMINSQVSNFRTYRMYLREMVTLAENVFEFDGLPDYIDVAYLNDTLLKKGAVAFFEDEVLGLLALPFNNINKRDVYGRPTEISVYGRNNYHRRLTRDEFVIMYDNNGMYPIYLDICQMAERIALCVRTQDVNVKHQRTPRIWKTSTEKEKSLTDLINDIDTNDDTIATYDSMDIDDLNVVLAPAPYVTDKIDQHLEKLWAEFYRLVGVANLQETKKERVIIDEMTASQGGTIASRFSRFEPRKRALEQINAKFNTDISVRYYDGEPDSRKGEDNVGLYDDLSVGTTDPETSETV